MYYRFFYNDAPVLKMPYVIRNISTQGECYHFCFSDKNGKDHEQWLIRPLKNHSDKSEKFIVSLDSVADSNWATHFIFDKSVPAFKFPVQDNYSAEWTFQPPKDIEHILEIDQYKLNYNVGTAFTNTAFLDSDLKIIDGFLESVAPSDTSVAPYLFFDSIPNLSAAKIANNKFLVGVHGKNIFKVDKGNISPIDDHFKNFRLRAIKKISKTRR